jgi:ribosomal protein L11 methyltransferase
MSDPMATEWPYVEVDAPAEAAEPIGSALFDAGSTGIEQRDLDDGRVRLVAYFAAPPALEEVAARVAAAPGLDPAVARDAAATARLGSTPDDDWLRIWKRGFEPTPIGERLLVFPSWRRDDAAAFSDRTRIEVDPGMAFGTGTHETTRLCLEWLDEHWHGGSLLDVGTGTGILAIAAARLEPGSHVVAVDVDPVAIGVARENAETNGVAERMAFDTCGPESVGGEFDVVLANLTADVILAVAVELVARARPGGALVLSGILADQADGVVAEMEDEGLELESRRGAGEWVALAMRKP